MVVEGTCAMTNREQSVRTRRCMPLINDKKTVFNFVLILQMAKSICADMPTLVWTQSGRHGDPEVIWECPD